MKYFLRIRYNGSSYHGWQVQPNAITVQEVIDKILQEHLKQTIETVGCGRTDTGVHASDFYLHFVVDQAIENPELELQKWNSRKLKGIQFCELFPVGEDAHARFDATSRTYTYKIMQVRDPFMDGLAWYVRGDLNLAAMNEAAALLIGKRDYSAFSKAHTQVMTNNCDIQLARWKQDGDFLYFTIRADRFLRNMVRAIVGTMMEVGQGKLNPEGILEIIDSQDRSRAGISVPAHGLYLSKVEYPEGLRNHL